MMLGMAGPSSALYGGLTMKCYYILNDSGAGRTRTGVVGDVGFVAISRRDSSESLGIH